MKVAILQSNYIPWIGYFDIVNYSDIFIFYDDVQYTKNDWRNRNLIKTNDGLKWVTVPVRSIQLDQLICDTQITSSKVFEKHLNSLRANYAKAPFFKSYFPTIEKIFSNLPSDLISDINQHIIKEMNKK